MNRLTEEQKKALVKKFEVLYSKENLTRLRTALVGYDDDCNELLEQVDIEIFHCVGTQEILLTYSALGRTQKKVYSAPPSECLNKIELGITEREELNISFAVFDPDEEAHLHFWYGDDLQIDNDIRINNTKTGECEIFDDCEGYWELEDIKELESV